MKTLRSADLISILVKTTTLLGFFMVLALLTSGLKGIAYSVSGALDARETTLDLKDHLAGIRQQHRQITGAEETLELPEAPDVEAALALIAEELQTEATLVYFGAPTPVATQGNISAATASFRIQLESANVDRALELLGGTFPLMEVLSIQTTGGSANGVLLSGSGVAIIHGERVDP